MINIKARLEARRPQRAETFSGADLLKKVQTHLASGANVAPPNLEALNKGLGTVEGSHFSPETLRDLHERSLLAIADDYNDAHDSIKSARQLADLRKLLTVWAFRAAVEEVNQNRQSWGLKGEMGGDYALAIGGSLVTGLHTFFTDVDSVLIPHTPEDGREAGIVQLLMRRNLGALYIENDWAMQMAYGQSTFDEVKQLFPPIKLEYNEDLKARLVNHGYFYTFLMDMEIVAANGEAPINAYDNKLQAYRQEAVFENADAIGYMAAKLYKYSLEQNAAREDKTIDVKEDAIRLFNFAAYAARARFGLQTTSVWDSIPAMEKAGLISKEEQTSFSAALSSLLGFRHAISLAIEELKDTSKLTGQVAEKIGQRQGKETAALLAEVEASRRSVIAAAETLFARLGLDLNKLD